MSAITHDMVIKASCSSVYKALASAQGLRSWFTAQVEGSGQPGSEWHMKFIDEPSFNWQIISAEKENQVIWNCLQGPGNSPGTEVEFNLKPTSDKQCTLTISHRGWAKDDPKFDECIAIWRNLMNHLKQYCETGVAAPAYQ